MNDHIFVIAGNGGKPFHVPREQADRVVAIGAARWIAKRKIKLVTDHCGDGIALLPEFYELLKDTEHWVDWKKRTLRMSEEKQEFLHAMKRL